MPTSGGYKKHIKILMTGTGSEIMSGFSYQGQEGKGSEMDCPVSPYSSF